MSTLRKNIRKVLELSRKEKKCSNRQFIHLTSEVGELAVELQIKNGDCKPEKAGEDGILGECVDVAQCAISIFARNGGTIEELNNLFELKNEKWECQIKKYKDERNT